MPEASVSLRARRKADIHEDARALHAAVADLVRVYQFRDRDRICCHDISVTQCYALETLVEQGPMRLGTLAQQLFLDKSTTSRVIGALVRKGYVEQREEETDRRARLLHTTPAGKRLCVRITDGLVEQQKQLLQEMAPEVRSAIIQVVRSLARTADARFRAGTPVERGSGCCPSVGNVEGAAVCR
jgi:MarR family transcriptional regulator, 2-MHQ and catechol-resistance regulon repressor